MSSQPTSNQTVYVRNISEKVKQDPLRRALYLTFSTFGNVIEVHCPRTKKIRGQAWIVYDEPAGAVQAVAEMNGKMFFGKPIEVTFAKKKSDIIAKFEGTYVPRPKQTKEEENKSASTGSSDAMADSRSQVKKEEGESEDAAKLLGVKRGLDNSSAESGDSKLVKVESGDDKSGE